MSFCTHCGEAVDDAVERCPHCGATQTPNLEARVTPFPRREPEERPSTPRSHRWLRFVAAGTGGVVMVAGGLAAWRYHAVQETLAAARQAIAAGRYQDAAQALATVQRKGWPWSFLAQPEQAQVQALLQSESAYQEGERAFQAGDYQKALAAWAKVSPQDVHYRAAQQQSHTVSQVLHAAGLATGLLKAVLNVDQDLGQFDNAYEQVSSTYNQANADAIQTFFGPYNVPLDDLTALSDAVSRLDSATGQLTSDADALSAAIGAVQADPLLGSLPLAAVSTDTAGMVNSAQTILNDAQGALNDLQGGQGLPLATLAQSINANLSDMHRSHTQWQQQVANIAGQILERLSRQLGPNADVTPLVPELPQAKAL